MHKRTIPAVSVLALVVTLAVPLLARTMRLTANIPFEFSVSDRTLPAGEYSINTDSGLVMLRGATEPAGTFTLAHRTTAQSKYADTETKLVFNRYGNRYFLSEIRYGNVSDGMQVPMIQTERELAKTASAARPETVTVLARLAAAR